MPRVGFRAHPDNRPPDGAGRSLTTREQDTGTLPEETLRPVLAALGYVVAVCDGRGRVLDADDRWSSLLGPVDHDVSLIHPRLVPDGAPTTLDETANGLSGSLVSLRGVVTTLLPCHKNGDISAVELASFRLHRDDGAFLVAARETPGRDVDDLTRKYLAAFLESTDTAVIGARLDGTILHWNPAAACLYGYSALEAIGQNLTRIVPPERYGELAQAMAIVAGGEKVEGLDTLGVKKSGEKVELSVSITPIREPSGAVVGGIGLIRDISEHTAVDRLARLYARACETSPTGLLLWRQDAFEGTLRLIAANRTARRLGRLAAGSMGRTSTELAEQLPALAALHWPPSAQLEHGRLSLGTFKLEDTGAEATYVELHAFPLDDSTVGTTLTDVTKQAIAEQERRRLLGRVADAEDAERKKLAEALHDDTLQVLAAANMELGSLRRRTGDPDAAARAERVEEKIRHATRALRSLVFELYPPDLEIGGLGAGLRTLMEQTFDDGTELNLVDDLSRRPGSETRFTAYRILQEALANARQHAKARHVSVRLAHEGDVLVATVRDDGIGFDAAEVSLRPGHLGLRTMRERAQSHDGSIEVRQMAPGAEIELRLFDPPHPTKTRGD